MALLLRVILAVVALAQSPAAQLSQVPVSPQAAAIDRLLADAEAARLKADFVTMQRLSTDAVAQSRAIDDQARLANSLNTRAQSFFYSSQVADCVPVAREALRVVAPLNRPGAETVIVNTLANCLRGVGDFEDAIDTYRRAIELARVTKNTARESQVLSNIAVVYTRIGEPELARASAEQAATRAREAGNLQFESYALQVIGNALNYLGQYDRALASHRESLARIEAQPPSNIVTLARLEQLVNIAVVEHAAGRYEEAVTSMTYALDQAHASVPYPLLDAVAQTYLGWSHLMLTRLDDAERWFLQARQAWRAVDDVSMAGETLATEIGYARVLRARGRNAEALAVDEAALVTLDRLRSGRNVTGSSAATTLVQATRAYADTIGLLIAQGRTADAFDVSERYRARVFLDTLDERRSGIGQLMTDAQRALETKLTDDGTRVQMRLWDAKTTNAERVDLTRRLTAIDQDLDALRREVRRQDPRYGEVHFPVLLRSADVSRSLAADTAVVSYVLGDERSFVFAVTSTGVTAAALPAESVLATNVTAFRDLLSMRPTAGASRLSALRDKASTLTTTLLGPVATSVRGKQRVILMPDGVLSTLPFEALRAISSTSQPTPRGTWLTEQFALSYAPSASALASIATQGATADRTAGLLALGDPLLSPPGTTRDATSPFTALPYTRVEVQNIAKLFGTSGHAFIGAAATPDAFTREQLDTYRYIHLASHAFVNTTRPGRSGIVLSPDPKTKSTGILQADDVMKFRLNADLVTLSACSTGLGKTVAGEGVMGLARSFLIAGSRSVAASLWNVNDEATATLMVRFYSGLKAGLPRDEALSAARRSLIRGTNERLKDPYYWAPFVLIGSAR